jgi:hypothetical protein
MPVQRQNIILLFSALALLFIADHTYAQSQTITDLKNTVYYLASDSLAGRAAGSSGELKAAKFIASEFKSYGLKKLTKNYFQTFEFSTDSSHRDTSQNVIGWINNHANRSIVIGAHYDHIGMGGKYSRSIGKRAVHPGADDNASGVALMLDIARWLAKTKCRQYNYYIVAFGAHEVGLFGSKYFVKSNIVDTSNITLMINLDMVGRYDTVSKTFICEGSFPLSDTLASLDDNTPYKIKNRDMTMGDHTAFQEKHIYVLRYTTGMHDDYHTINDKAEKINYPGMFILDNYLRKFLLIIDKCDFLAEPD